MPKLPRWQLESKRKQSLANLKPAKPGEIRNPMGKAVGTRDTLTRRFLNSLARDFEAHGDAAIVEMREKDVVRYVMCVAGLVPKEIEIKHPLDGLSDEQISAGIDFLSSQLAQRVSIGVIEAESAEAVN